MEVNVKLVYDILIAVILFFYLELELLGDLENWDKCKLVSFFLKYFFYWRIIYISLGYKYISVRIFI